MPKHEALTPKAIANRIKAKGLQKLRWYCQMCNKQCRDQNGFKCHLMSESHQRQLLLFAESPGQYMNEFNKDFEKGYMDILRRQFGTKRVHCNVVYQEYIKDRNHVHMNSTSWYTLTGFVQYLGRSGICRIDETEKGWYIQYIDQEEEERREKVAKKQKMDKDDEERIMELVLKQADRARKRQEDESLVQDETACGSSSASSIPTALLKTDEEIKIEFKLPKLNVGEKHLKNYANLSSTSALSEVVKKKDEKRSLFEKTRSISSGKKSALDEIKEAEERSKELKNRKDYWLHEGIVVKIVTKKLGDLFYKRKGVVESVENRYQALVRLLENNTTGGDLIKLDQSHLETVIPGIGKPLLVVNGAYRGHRAILEKLEEQSFSVSVRIDEGHLNGRLVEGVQYEDVCKLHVTDT